MQKKCFFLLTLGIIILNSDAATSIDHIMTFFVQPYPIDEVGEAKNKKMIDKLQQTIATPGKIAYKITKAQIPDSLNGFFVTYRGYVVVANMMGQITLPRLTQQPLLPVLITEQIEPIMMIGNTVHHWELSKNNPAQMYMLERKEDPETKLTFWEYKESALPENNIIPLNALVLLTRPKDIVVPLGITLSTPDQQWILPTLYAKKNSSLLESALSILKVRQFFGPITVIRKKASNTNYASQISTQE